MTHASMKRSACRVVLITGITLALLPGSGSAVTTDEHGRFQSWDGNGYPMLCDASGNCITSDTPFALSARNASADR